MYAHDKINGKNCIGLRSIAFIDILGFKSILDEYSLENIGSAYDMLIPNVDRNHKEYESHFGRHENFCIKSVMSDSIIIVSNDESEGAFLDLIRYANRFIQTAFFCGFPCRGAITFGEIYVNESTNVFIGKSIAELVALEKKQEWIGVILDEKIKNRFLSFFDSLISTDMIKIKDKETPILNYKHPQIIKYPVPFKCDHSHVHYTLNWLHKWPNFPNMNESKPEDFLKKMMNKSPESTKSKYKNTMAYISYINDVFPENGAYFKYEPQKDLFSQS